MKPLAIVIPWWGRELKGGAEQHAWQVASQLANRGHQVEVLTTCCRSFLDDWSVNHFSAGVSYEQQIKVRRFPVNKRDRHSFDLVNSLMLNLSSKLKPGVNPVTLEDANIFCNENINSTALLNYLETNHAQYHAFIFLPYLYGCILNGLPIVANKAFLQPCLHDEVYAYLPQVANIFHAAKALLFISEGEAELAKKLYGPGIIHKSIVVGAGAEPGKNNSNIDKIADLAVKQEPYVLCLGRRDATKNTDLLVRAYANFKQQYPNSNLKLVLAGPGNQSFHNHVSGVVDLALVEESEKDILLANCLALFQPSQNESYSRVIMEAWFYQRPVAAHRSCLATAMAVEKAQGGWLAETEIEWAELFAQIDQVSAEELVIYGINGQAYAKQYAVWDKIIDGYESALGLSQPGAPINTIYSSRKLKAIHQLLPNLAYGDAISNHAIAIKNYLRSCGYESEIFIRYIDGRVADEAKVFEPSYLSSQAGLIYHHSIGSELTKYAIAHKGPKCLIYHNITPAEFFLPYRPDFADILAQGRLDLNQLAPYFHLCVGDSAYNASELQECGFHQPGVLPIGIDPSKWDICPDATFMEQLQDGKANLLFVGRLAPNKRQDHLIEAFYHYLTMAQEARLIIAGYGDLNDPYYCHLLNTIQKFGIKNYIFMPGHINDAQLLALYRTAHLFWSMSEHEGFCVPLIESMWFDIPILAYKSTAVPETLAEAGLMFTTKDNFVQVAALAKLLVHDQKLRAKVIEAQRRRRTNFLPVNTNSVLNQLISQLEEITK